MTNKIVAGYEIVKKDDLKLLDDDYNARRANNPPKKTQKTSEKVNRKYHRWQLPSETAFACTTHKMQGTTAIHGAVVEPSLNDPIIYVALSRPTDLSKLVLLAPLRDIYLTCRPKERYAVNEEYLELRTKFPIPEQFLPVTLAPTTD
jgi:hypothetical protein